MNRNAIEKLRLRPKENEAGPDLETNAYWQGVRHGFNDAIDTVLALEDEPVGDARKALDALKRIGSRRHSLTCERFAKNHECSCGGNQDYETIRRALTPAPEIEEKESRLDELERLLPDICQLIDAVRQDGISEGWWTEWDQSVRDRITAYNLRRLKDA